MGFMNELGGLMSQYVGASASAPPPTVTQDFEQASSQAPPSVLSAGLNDAFRSPDTPSFGAMVSQLFANSDGNQRAGILNHLIGAAGPAALASPALGALSSLLHGSSTISPEATQQVSPEAVQHLAEHAEKQDPSIIDRVSEFYSQHSTLLQGLGAGALTLIMSRMSQHR